MTGSRATAEVFWTAFRTLPKNAREDFLDRLMVDRRIRRELEDRLDNEAAERALDEPGRIPWEAVKQNLKR